MENVRRAILYLSIAIGVWVLVSFGGTMFDTANAGVWVKSLMWSLLSALFVMPALLMVSDVSRSKASKRTTQTQEPEPSPEEEQKPFVDKSTKEVKTLWPEPEQKDDWPPNDIAKNQRQSQRARTNA